MTTIAALKKERHTAFEAYEAARKTLDDLKLEAAPAGETAEQLKTRKGAFDAKRSAAQTDYDTAFEAVSDVDSRIKRAKDALDLAGRGAVPVPGQEGRRIILPAQPRKAYGKLRCFQGNVDFGEGVILSAEERAYRAGMWTRAAMFDDAKAAEWCREHGISLQRAQSEGINSAGGALVPEEMMGEIIVLRETYGAFRRATRVVPMGRDTMNWPRRTGGVTAYFVSENKAPTESQSAWDNVNLTAKKIAALIRYSTDLAEDAIQDIGDWTTGEIAYAFAAKEDDCGFNGDGTSTYGGIRGVTVIMNDGSHTAGLITATGHSTVSAVDATDVTKLMATLPFYALPRAKFYCSQYVFAALFGRLAATAGGNTIATVSGQVQYQYLGFEVVICQKMKGVGATTGDIVLLYGDLGLAAALGDRRQITIMRSEHRYMDTDQIGILGTQRFDINVHDCGDTSNAGPITALKLG